MSFLGQLLGVKPSTSAADTAATPAATETVRRISEALNRMDPRKARFIACFAYLLSRVARADLDISDEETHEMEKIIQQRGGLPEEQAVLCVQIARTQATLFGHTENFLVSREFNLEAGRKEKLALLDCLFAVSAADHDVSTVEDNEIRKISEELKLDHQDFIRARSAYLKDLAVLKNRPRGAGGKR
ncbi:MAG: TerB family tellurite resistance protein [Acidobacteriota bacterium]